MTLVIALHDQATELQFPACLHKPIALLFGTAVSPLRAPNHVISIRAVSPDRFSIGGDTRRIYTEELTEPELLDALLDEVVHSLIYHLDSAVALHAASVGWRDKSILIPGPTGSGKTSLAAWFVTRNFEFITDELVVIADRGSKALTIPRPLLAKTETDALLALLAKAGRSRAVRTSANTVVCLDDLSGAPQARQPRLMIFPHFVAGSRLRVSSVTPAMSGLRLMGSNLNARNLRDHGFAVLAELSRNVPALNLTYGSYEQLDGVLDVLTRMVLESDVKVAELKKFTSAFGLTESELTESAKPPPAPRHPIPEATPRRQVTPKLTIGMAAYDDYDGVYFTLQSIRLYHPEILEQTEFLVVDNHPDGPCAQALKTLEQWIPNYRYVPKGDVSGTAARDAVFREAIGEIVLCIDCHVMIVNGALTRLIDHFNAHPGSKDLTQGPLLFDSLTSIATHFMPKWRAGMYGHWTPCPADISQVPFEITMQGLGLFACRRDAWPGLNPAFRGFGGEEGYIHEKFRRRGGRVLCLPFLQWIHRFGRPLGPPYANRWEDRIRNYFIGFRELGWDTAPITEHFKEVLGVEPTVRIVESIERELAARKMRGSSPPLVAEPSPASPVNAFEFVWDEAALSLQRRILQRVAEIADKHGIALYLYWGSLLGHVRQGGILPWDDDVDLAMFESDKAAELRAALKEVGLETHELHAGGEDWIKVYDPAYPVTPHQKLPWTWPNIDIFLYTLNGAPDVLSRQTCYPRDMILPGRRVVFEGAPVWEPENPPAVLDLQYGTWRYSERSSHYNHRREQLRAGFGTRWIATDSRGRKISEELVGQLLKTRQPTHPLQHTVFLPLLRAWTVLCRDHNVRYSIFWGTLLGQVRNRRIIPYDGDLDVVVGRAGLETLHALPGRAPGCVYNDALADQPAWKDHEIRLVVRRDLNLSDGPRYNHRGQRVETQVDSCAFNGPLARLIIKLPAEPGKRQLWHLDVDLFTELSHFEAYPAVQDVDELPELEERPLENLLVSCIKHPLPYLRAWYGEDYMVPDHVYHDGRWLRRQ